MKKLEIDFRKMSEEEYEDFVMNCTATRRQTKERA